MGELDYKDERVEWMSVKAGDVNIQKPSFTCSWFKKNWMA